MSSHNRELGVFQDVKDLVKSPRTKTALALAGILAFGANNEVNAQNEVTPDPNVRYTTEVTRDQGANLRSLPSATGRLLETVADGTRLEVSVTGITTADGVEWLQVWEINDVPVENTTYVARFVVGDLTEVDAEEAPAVAAPEAPEEPGEEAPIRETESPITGEYENVDDILTRLGVENVEDLAHPELFEDIIYQQSLELPNGHDSRFAIVANRTTFEEGGRTLYSPEMTPEAATAIQNYFDYMLQGLSEIEGDLYVPTADNQVLGSSGSSEAVEFVRTDLSNIVFVLVPDAVRGDLLYHVGNAGRDELSFAWRPEPSVDGSGLVIYLNIDESSHRSQDQSRNSNQYFVGSVFLTGTGAIREAIELQLEHTDENGEPQLLSMAADWASYYRGPGLNPWTEWANDEPALRELFGEVAETVTPVPDDE